MENIECMAFWVFSIKLCSFLMGPVLVFRISFLMFRTNLLVALEAVKAEVLAEDTTGLLIALRLIKPFYLSI